MNWGQYEAERRKKLEVRNGEILKARDEGATLDEVGWAHGLSRERIRQIVIKQRRLAIHRKRRSSPDRSAKDDIAAVLQSTPIHR